MKTTLLKSFIIVSISIFFASCAATHSGYLLNSAALSSANFSYVNWNVQGHAKASYVLGIGGLARQTLANDAKQDLLAKYPLKSNQALVNITVNFKISRYLGFYKSVTCILSADIVEFK